MGYLKYTSELNQQLKNLVITNLDGKTIDHDEVFQKIINLLKLNHDLGNKIYFIGNGGSAGICSHMAIDYSKNGNLRSQALNDGATLTCLSNDYGYDSVFQKQLEFYAKKNDTLVAISSSGNSKNIILAAEYGKKIGMNVLTFSGFMSDNFLRSLGEFNFYINNSNYGYVELSHQIILHAILDIKCGIFIPNNDI